jgi:hypothetical protein
MLPMAGIGGVVLLLLVAAGVFVARARTRAPSLSPVQPDRAGARTVFISYAHEDQAAVNAVCTALEAKGRSCWMAPRNIVP